ncbi:MAG: isoleucine--tRNA ligase [Actinomycetota bacterium]
MAAFDPVDPKVRFPELEERVLARWRADDVFAESLRRREGAPEWIFYEGPPTANGRPGIHHVESRTFKDVYPRFRTMTGYRVPRKAGWDCHGLPVELEVEKEIGTTGKRDIEAFGVAEFNRLCRSSVTRYVADWERMTERVGMWIDLSDAYWTMSTSYIESVWWSLKSLYERGLLFEADKVTPYCPRCGTALSDHEVALGYRQTEDPSLFLKLPITEADDPDLIDARIAVWTTTPWTLLSNLGLAVAADQPYELVEREGERIVIARELRERVLGEGWQPIDRMPGSALVGVRYEAPYTNVPEGTAHHVVAADFVSMDDGTGIVHIAPSFGADDLEIGLREGWPAYKPVRDDGTFDDRVPLFLRGRFVKDADELIVDDLTERGLVLRAGTYEHSYPFCWRCGTPLLNYARTSWYAGTTAVKQRLLEVNEDVGWYPEHIKDGRYGDWLRNNVDWALSRDRYWGTPLPIWRCAEGHATPIGSLRELGERADRNVEDVDPHRPWIDDVTFPCPDCGETATRVPEVIDTWYDSGAMPFAQWSYHPELGRGEQEFANAFPADFISEAIDQTRGWFYTLMAEGVLHFDSTAYRNVVCLGHIVDAQGRKMSKSLGNVIDPMEVMDRQGADALRWYLLTSGSPWASRRVSMELLDEVVRQFLLTLWNVYAFFVTYANADGFDPSEHGTVRAAERPVLDRWILSQLAATVQAARTGLESYDATGAGRRIQAFVGDLSNWYVRRARRRFWNPGGEGGDDTRAAFQTLHECLVTTATLLAPFTPFVADELWGTLAAGRGDQPGSVHLADYPEPDVERIDAPLDDAMRVAREIVELGRRIRVESKVRTRQPLAGAVVHHRGDREPLAGLFGLIADELNVKDVAFAESADELGTWRAKPNFSVLGPRLGGRVKQVADALAHDDGTLASILAGGTATEVPARDGPVLLAPGDVDLTQQTREGWGVAADAGLTVALELELDDALRNEGVARELIRIVQDARKATDLQVSDRIAIGVEAGPRLSAALDDYGEVVAAETLATGIEPRALAGAPRHEGMIEEEPVVVTLRRV